MIIYQQSKDTFLHDVIAGDIEETILQAFFKQTHRSTNKSEISSWRESLSYMERVLADKSIPHDSQVAIEYHLPQTSKRIDFMITGEDHEGTPHIIIIELKQWSHAKATTKDAVVETFVGGGVREVSHPSYQAWSYASLLQDFNQTVYDDQISLQPCAYLHNYSEDEIISSDFYRAHIQRAPLFLKHDALKLREFIKRFIHVGGSKNLLYRIDNGKIKPSKSLADSLEKVMIGNDEFVMIDDQKVVYETALALSKMAQPEHKQVLIVEGGPGTGKSVVAINLLVESTRRGLLSQYVTKNAAPRAVYESKLARTMGRTRFSMLFTGSGSFLNAPQNAYDILIVDEAHRLNEKSGLMRNLGENQVKEIIDASRCAVFFIDEDQKVTLHDIGTQEEITRWAKQFGASVQTMKLESQFRCNGSDGYLAWVDEVLQIRETANTSLTEIDFDFRVMDSPSQLRDAIYEKNKENNKARLVAGYCWDWVSKKDSGLMDIILPGTDFAAQWNLSSDGNLWILAPESVQQVGCIHTCQGLEVDYVGVIIGPDLVVRDGKVITDVSKRAKTDGSVRGAKSLMAHDGASAESRLDSIIKNTYRTLMTRGMKGCYVWSGDEETKRYLMQIKQ